MDHFDHDRCADAVEGLDVCVVGKHDSLGGALPADCAGKCRHVSHGLCPLDLQGASPEGCRCQHHESGQDQHDSRQDGYSRPIT